MLGAPWEKEQRDPVILQIHLRVLTEQIQALDVLSGLMSTSQMLESSDRMYSIEKKPH